VSPRVLVALSTFGEYSDEPRRLLNESGLEYSVNPLGRRLVREEIIEMGKDCEGIVAGVEPYDEYVLDRLPRLRCISRCGVGIDNISLEKAREKGIAVRNTPEVVVLPVAELTIGMIFDLLRNLTYHTHELRSKRWTKKAGNLLCGRKVGVIGLGRIGKKVAELLTGLGADVYGADIRPDHEWARRTGVKVIPLGSLLTECDVITIHVSVLENDRFLLGGRELQAVRKGALIVNVSRGEVIDEEALHDALKSGHLGGAALDVFRKEPYDGPLSDLDNVVLTPHIATLTEESRGQMEIEAVQNLIDFFRPGN